MSTIEFSENAVGDDRLVEMMSDEDLIVKVSNLQKRFPIYSSILRRPVEHVGAVDRVSFAIPTGDTFGLVGESGSGKTTLGKCLLRIIEPSDGQVEIDGRNVTEMSKSELKQFRQQVQMIPQDPTSSLNPRRRVRNIVTEPLKIHDIGTKQEQLERAEELLETVGLSADFLYRYPGSLSGGQKQRIAIARALILNPSFVVLDEPTSALDVSVQARIVDLFQDLQDEYDLTYLFISHDLSLVKNISDWMGIMYLGRLVEVGPTEEVFNNPQHPYTKALLSAIPILSDADQEMIPEKIEVEGEVPDPRQRPSGCGFRTRCPKEFEPCSQREPPFYRVGSQHFARCFLNDTELS